MYIHTYPYTHIQTPCCPITQSVYPCTNVTSSPKLIILDDWRDGFPHLWLLWSTDTFVPVYVFKDSLKLCLAPPGGSADRSVAPYTRRLWVWFPAYLGCRLDPRPGLTREAPSDVSLQHQCSPSPPFPPSNVGDRIPGWGFKKHIGIILFSHLKLNNLTYPLTKQISPTLS